VAGSPSGLSADEQAGSGSSTTVRATSPAISACAEPNVAGSATARPRRIHERRSTFRTRAPGACQQQASQHRDNQREDQTWPSRVRSGRGESVRAREQRPRQGEKTHTDAIAPPQGPIAGFRSRTASGSASPRPPARAAWPLPGWAQHAHQRQPGPDWRRRSAG